MTARIDTDAVAAEVLELLALGDNPDLNAVLDRIVRAARRQADARYAAIGVPDGRGGFARFVTSGISDGARHSRRTRGLRHPPNGGCRRAPVG